MIKTHIFGIYIARPKSMNCETYVYGSGDRELHVKIADIYFIFCILLKISVCVFQDRDDFIEIFYW